MLPCNQAHFGERQTQSGSRTKVRHVAPVCPMPIENFEWNVELAAPCMNRKCLQQPGEGVSKSGVMSQVTRFGAPLVDHLRG